MGQGPFLKGGLGAIRLIWRGEFNSEVVGQQGQRTVLGTLCLLAYMLPESTRYSLDALAN